VLATKRFTVGAGAKRRVVLRLDARDRRALRRAGSALLRVRTTSEGRTTTRTLRLKPQGGRASRG
jgi:hypothetical protein